MAARFSTRDLWRYFQLVLLAFAAGTATFARSAMGPLQEAMHTALGLSDNQTALLQGMALGVPLALGSIPFGLVADRSSRRRLLIFSVAITLFACVLSAFATNFGLMLIARCLVGLAMPGMLVASYSMAGDLVPLSARGRATTVVALGELGGAPLAFWVGGLLLARLASEPGTTVFGIKLVGWNESLLIMGLLIVPVLVSTFLLREPVRTETKLKNPPMREVWPELWSYRHLAIPLQLGRATLFIADGAVFVWGAPFLSRRFHLPVDRIGSILAVVLLISGIIGPFVGGPLVDWCQRHGGPRRAMRVLAVLAFACVPIGLFALVPSVTGASLLLFIFLSVGGAIGSAALSLTLVVIPGELRGLNVGISLVIGSLFFVVIAPLTVSVLSGVLGGPMLIGKALAIVCGTASLLNALVFTFTARYFPGASIDAMPDTPAGELAPTGG